jgi:hypothetical protein
MSFALSGIKKSILGGNLRIQLCLRHMTSPLIKKKHQYNLMKKEGANYSIYRFYK